MRIVVSLLAALVFLSPGIIAAHSAPKKPANAKAESTPEVDVSASKDFPIRKAGLWEIRTTAAHAAGLSAVSFCVGDATDSTLEHLDRTFGVKGACRVSPFRPVGNAWVSESVCKDGRTNITSKSIASGDLSTSYRVDTQTFYTVALPGNPATKREDSEALEGKYLGACPAGMRVSDLAIAGMGKINMRDGAVTVPKPPRQGKKKKQS